MAKVDVSINYLSAVNHFKTVLRNALLTGGAYPNITDVSVDVSNGRKFDRVRVIYSYNIENPITGNTENHTGPWHVQFFIERLTGAIYGKKTNTMPNMNWYFGEVYSVDEWEWTANGAIPKDLTKYEVASKYDKYVHYRRISQPTH